MKQLILALVFAFSGMTVTVESASAQGLGTYCSAKTAEGFWAMKFGPEPTSHNCAVVQRALRSRTSNPITGLNHGFYNLHGINRVLISCGFYYRNVITSIGGYALQNAVNTAQYASMTHCMFAVNGH